MKPNMMRRIAVDLGMTVILLLLMAYELVGQAVHEWLGVGMFLLLVLHHILNGKWSRNMGKGRYTAFRILQTILVLGVLLTMIGSMVSGVILSRHVFSFLPIQGGRSLARSLHMVCGYGGFILMTLHLGIHWTMMIGIVKKCRKDLRGIAILIAGYGLRAFVKRDIAGYMFLRNQFVFFDFEEPLIFFFLDYMTIMGLFVFVGYYVSQVLRNLRT